MDAARITPTIVIGIADILEQRPSAGGVTTAGFERPS